MASDAVLIPRLISIAASPVECEKVRDKAFEAMRPIYGKKTAHNACACTLSMFLREAGFDVKVQYGAQRLANTLSVQRQWVKISVGDQAPGDVAVTIDGDGNGGADHIFLVVKAYGADRMLIADNQTATCPHERFASGKGRTRVDYFLRAPGYAPLSAESLRDLSAEFDVADDDEDTNHLPAASSDDT